MTPGLLLAVIVVVALVVTFGLIGAFSGSPNGSSASGASGSTFDSARTAADSFAASYGSWHLVEGIGLALANSTILPVSNETGAHNCTTTVLVGTVPSNVSLSAYRGNLSDGTAPVWLFGFFNPTTGALLAVLLSGGVVILATEDSSGCTNGEFANAPGITGTVVDSPEAVAVAAAAGGFSFLRAHPTGVSLTMFVLGGFSFANESQIWPVWEVEWSTCPSVFSGEESNVSGFDFGASVNATTGLLIPGSATNSTCGGIPTPPVGIGQVLVAGAASLIVGAAGGTIPSTGCDDSDECYSVPIVSVEGNVTPNEFELTVTNSSSGIVLPTVVGYAILTPGGGVLVYSIGPYEVTWSPELGNPASPITAGMTVVVDLGPPPPPVESLSLVFTGEGPFSDSILSLGL